MREIKFRAWEKRYGEYVEILTLYHQDGVFAATCCNDGKTTTPYFYPEDIDIEQFTGLRDKDGKEIYDGDIVDGIIISGDKYKASEVAFDGGAFSLKVDPNYWPCLYEAWPEHLKIIGNIHENPDLLKTDY